MDDMPKLAKDAILLVAKKRKSAPLANALLLLGTTVFAGLGLLQGAPTGSVAPMDSSSTTIKTTPKLQIATPAPLVLRPAGVGAPLLAQHRSHSSHSSHRSHSSHHSRSF